MAVDPFEDDPFEEVVPAEWRRQSRAARRSLERIARVQARRRGPPENLESLQMPEPQQPAAVGQGQGDVAQSLRELNDTARAIRQLLEEIKNSLPLVGAYGP